MAIEKIQNYVCGTWQTGSGGPVELMNPASGEVLATADAAGLDLAEALHFGRTVGGKSLRAMRFSERADMLAAMAAAIHEAREPLILSAIQNGGCTRSDAKFDIDGAILSFNAYAELGRTLGDGTVLPDGEGIQLGRSPRFWAQHIYVSRQGVALLINAFNFPAWGFAEKAACALLAGMPVLNKPATSTSHTAWKMTQVLVEKAVCPKGALSFVAGPAHTIADHLESQDVLAFTGSADTARRLRSNPRVVAESVRVNVEADSLNAAVLGPDVEVGSETFNLFLKEVAREISQKTGQKCTAVRRVLVPENRVDEVVLGLAERLSEIKLGNPAHKDVRMGPLASKAQLADVQAGVARLAGESDVVFGDPSLLPDLIEASKDKGCFFPILLMRAKDSTSAALVHSHEVFGPVSTVLSYSGEAEAAIDLVQKGNGSLVASVYSDDRKFTEAAALGIAAYSGRVYLGSEKVAEHTMGSGLVFPTCVHGGPGRAGGGEELGGLRGVHHYMQRTVIQGSRPTVASITNTKPA